MRWLIDKLGMPGLTFVATLGLFFWMLLVALEQQEKIDAEFVAACDAVHGTAVRNRKHWECLK